MRLAVPALLLLAIVVTGSSCADPREVLPPSPREATAALPRVERPEAMQENRRAAILSAIRHHRRAQDETWCRDLADTIYEQSVAASVDPLIVTSIIATESSFRATVVGGAGEVGLMQLRPFVAEDLARRVQMDWRGVETLLTPELNVKLGIVYYKELLERFEGDVRAALTAYNRGPTRVSRQMRSGTYAGSGYAEKILERYHRLGRTDG